MGDGVEEVVEGVRGGIGGRVRGEMQDYGLCGAGPEMARFDGRDVPRLFSRVVGGDEGHLVKGIERKGVDGVEEGEEVLMMEVGSGEECGVGSEGEGATVVKGAVGEGGDVHAVDQAKGMVGRDEKGKGEC